MTECVVNKPAATPTACGGGGEGACSPQSDFMTQASRGKQHKRKSYLPDKEPPHAAAEEEDLTTCKRLRTDAEALEDDAQAQEDGVPHRPSEEVEEPGNHAVREDGRQPVKGKSMLSHAAACFSPLFNVFHRNITAAAAADIAAPDLNDPERDQHSRASGEDVSHPEQQQLATTATAGEGAIRESLRGQHAHHPAPPEVPEAAESELDEDDEFEFDPLLFIKTLPPLEQCIPKYRPDLLPPQTRQCKLKTLVLDLDETLVHSSLEHAPSSDFSFDVRFNNQDHVIHVKKRPHLHEFMDRVAQLFEVVVFTASQKVYAEKLLNVIDPRRTLIKHRVYRDSCVMVDGNYLKDLTILGRDLRSTFIVDNSPQAFGFQPDNGIPIESWYDDEDDDELLKLLPFLQSLSVSDVDDVRPLIATKYRLKELIAKIQM